MEENTNFGLIAYDNEEDLERKLWMNQFKGGTAAVFIEPVGPESGTTPLAYDFNKGVERLCLQIRP